MQKIEGYNLHNGMNTLDLPYTVEATCTLNSVQNESSDYSHIQNDNSALFHPSSDFYSEQRRIRHNPVLSLATSDNHYFGYENSRSSLRDNEPFFIPSLNMPGESEMEPNFSYSSCDHSTSIYPSRFSNYAGDYYSNEPSERDYYRRSTFDVSSRFAGPVDRHRFYSESTLEVGNYRNYLFRPRLNAETHLQFEDVPLYPNSHIQTDSTTSRTFTPMETSLQPSKRTIPKKVSDPLSSQILNPDEIDPSINPGVFSGRKPRKQMDYSRYRIHLDDVQAGRDVRLTLMIRNIPNCFTQDQMLDIFNSFVKDEYDFFYMPVDFKTNCNLGFGYISMLSTESVLKVYYKLNGKRWNTTSSKVCEITYARMQGKAAMESFCKDWTIMSLPAKYRPVFFNKEVVMVDGVEKVVMKRVSN